jgi:saccharopine dehydrogenase-like NADP-dependent oxidoreductase
MTNVLILGAHGQIAQVAIELFRRLADVRLTLYLRNARRLRRPGPSDRLRVIEGDVLDTKASRSRMPRRWCRAKASPISSSSWQ